MPYYRYSCVYCKHSIDIEHPISECEKPTLETLAQITCAKHGISMRRVPQEVAFNGTGTTEQEKLKQKQRQQKIRARQATAQQLEANDRDIHPKDRERLRKRYKSKEFKNLKGNPFAKGK
jgi:predicted nucleic acid-binding Zn ribbon protein